MIIVIWVGLFLVAAIFVFGLVWMLEKDYDRRYPHTIGYHDEWD